MTLNIINVLEFTYRLSLALKLVVSKVEFSERFLGKGASYLTSMSARGRSPSRDVLLTLESKLLALMTADNGITDCGMDCAPTTTQYYARLRRVCEFVKAARLVHDAFADNFYPANDNVPPRERSARVVALSYCCSHEDRVDAALQPLRMEVGR